MSRKPPQQVANSTGARGQVTGASAKGDANTGRLAVLSGPQWAPAEPARPHPATRGISIAFRTLHLVSFSILLGGHAFDVEPDRLLTALLCTIASGIGLIAVEVYSSGLCWFFLGKGIVVLLKLAIVLAIPFFWRSRVILLLLEMIIASVGSHMPARYRHYSVVHGRLVQPGEKLALAPPNKET